MPNTYVALKTETVTGSPASSVTFDLTGISGYTDLFVVADVTMSSPSGTTYIVGRVGNGTIDTGSNYSSTVLVGNGSTATSYRTGSVSYFQCDTYITGSNRAMFEVNFQSYANTSVNKTILGRTSSAATNASAIAARWASNSAITTIRFYDFSGNSFAVGSTFSLYGIANADQGAAKATGGIITEDSQYWYHTFGASGAFIPKQSLTCDVLVVAGGGGASGSVNGGIGNGGGGAGGLAYYASQSLTATSYTCTVGAGGPGASNGSTATSGVNSSFTGLTAAVGGGYGARSGVAGANGGSGGGGHAAFSPGTGTTGQGNNGGNGSSTANGYGGGGGGGAGAVGSAGSGTAGGAGGIGTATYSSWGVATGIGQNVSGTYYLAGGGGGAIYWSIYGPSGAGGLGGGGAGDAQTGVAGLANTGGGGGAAGGQPSFGTGAAGGSGVIIVRYAK
jgi:hypothetical protein